jgi:serine protein kinase
MMAKLGLWARASNDSKNSYWRSYEKIREVTARRIFSRMEELLPEIGFGSKKDTETEKLAELLVRMTQRGCTERHVRRLIERRMCVK